MAQFFALIMFEDNLIICFINFVKHKFNFCANKCTKNLNILYYILNASMSYFLIKVLKIEEGGLFTVDKLLREKSGLFLLEVPNRIFR